jgi:hypothetical protein
MVVVRVLLSRPNGRHSLFGTGLVATKFLLEQVWWPLSFCWNMLGGHQGLVGTSLVATNVLLHVFNSNFLSFSCLICYNVTWCPHDVFLK